MSNARITVDTPRKYYAADRLTRFGERAKWLNAPDRTLQAHPFPEQDFAWY